MPFSVAVYVSLRSGCKTNTTFKNSEDGALLNKLGQKRQLNIFVFWLVSEACTYKRIAFANSRSSSRVGPSTCARKRKILEEICWHVKRALLTTEFGCQPAIVSHRGLKQCVDFVPASKKL